MIGKSHRKQSAGVPVDVQSNVHVLSYVHFGIPRHTCTWDDPATSVYKGHPGTVGVTLVYLDTLQQGDGWVAGISQDCQSVQGHGGCHTLDRHPWIIPCMSG